MLKPAGGYWSDFNRLPSNIIKRGCLAAPVKKFFNLEVVTMMIEMTALIIKRKMRDDENFKLTKNNLMIDMTALIIKRKMRDDKVTSF